MQIFILNQDKRIIGSLTSDAQNMKATPFFDDTYNLNLETGAETFEFSTFADSPQANKITVGNYIAFKFKDDYKLFQITETTDKHDEEFITTAYCEMCGIELINKTFRPRNFASTTLKAFVSSCLEDTDWKVGSIDPNIVNVYTIDVEGYSNVYSVLQQNVVNVFGGELAFRVEIKNGVVVGKYVDVFAERGTFNGFRISYEKNMESITRTVDSSELATALVGVGKDNLTFASVSEGDKPLNQDWLGDEEAYKRWNKNGQHIMGTFEFETDSPQELLNETRKALKKRINPKISYEVAVGYDDDLDIGDTVFVVDNEFTPPLHLSARVKELTISFTDTDKGSCTLSNFKEVRSNITDEMRQLASLIDEKFPIGTDQIKDNAITNDKIGENAVNGSQIQHDTLISDHIKANQIKTNHLEANSITAEKINSGEIKTEHLQALSVTTEKLAANVVTSDKIEAGSIQTGHLTGNLIESTHIKADQIEAGHIKSDSIETNHLKANSINTDKLQANSISTDKLQANSVNADKLQANSVTTDKLQANSINADKLQANSVTTDKLSANSVNADKIQANSIKGTHIQGEVIQGSHIMGETIEGKHLKGEIIEGTHIKGETIEGTHIKGDTITGNHIQSTTIQTEHLQSYIIEGGHIKSDTIGAGHIKSDSITTDHLQADSVDASKIKADSIETEHLKSNIIEADHIKSNTITANEIKGQSITGNEIKGNTISGTHIQGQSITSNHIQANAIGSTQIQTGALTSDKMVIANGFIKDAMIDNINASKIKTGKIDTSKVTIESANGNIIIADATQQFKDKNGKVRVQIGQDSQGEFNFSVLDETGKGVLIDHTGIKEKAVSNGFIKNNMIGNGEIDGAKVNINSIIDKVNNDGTKTLNASKVKLDTENQTLDVSFKQMNSKIDNISVGGRNYLQVNSWSKNSYIEFEGYTMLLSKSDSSKYEGTSFRTQNIPLIGNTDYVFSFKVKRLTGTLERIGGHVDSTVYSKMTATLDGVPFVYHSPTTSSTLNDGEYHEVIVKLTTTENPTGLIYIQGNRGLDTACTLEVVDWQLEIGNVKTDWKPAIEDTNSKIETLETTIGVEQGKINTLITNTTIEKNGTQMTIKDAHNILEQTVNGLNSTVSETTTKLNNLSVGGKNLIRYTDFKRYDTDKWRSYNSTNGSITFDKDNGWAILTGKVLGVNGITHLSTQYNTEDKVESGKTYQLSFTAYVETGTLAMDYCYIMSSEGNVQLGGYPTITTTPMRYTISAKISQTRNDVSVLIGSRNLAVGNKLYVKDIKLEEGTVVTDYSVSPHDVSAEVTHAESLIEQNAKKIELKVNVDGVKSAISLDESGVKIGGEHIDLEGQVTFKSLDPNLSEVFGTEYGKTVIDGGKIKTGSVTADKVDVHNLTVKDSDENITLHITEEGSVSMSGDISSHDFNEIDNTGWSLTKEGNATLNNATVRGNVITQEAGISNYGAFNGKENLLRYTDFENATIEQFKTEWAVNSSTIASVVKQKYTWGKAQDKPLHNKGILTHKVDRVKNSQQTTPVGQVRLNPYDNTNKTHAYFTLEPNTTYTLSGWYYKSFNTTSFYWVVWSYDDNGTTDSRTRLVSSDTYSEYTGYFVKKDFTFTTNSRKRYEISFYHNFDKTATTGNSEVHFYNLKLEKGSVASAWCPSSKDKMNYTRFWAGADYENREKAPFRVLQDGSIYATKGRFEGTFTGRLEVGDIVLEDTGKGYLQMNDNNKNKVIFIGEDEVYFKPSTMFGDTNNNVKINTSEVSLTNRTLSITKLSGNVQSTVMKVNPNSSTFMELNGTHKLKTSNSTLEIIGNHTQFSNDVSIVGDLSADNMVVGEMRMERKNDSGNKGIDFIFI